MDLKHTENFNENSQWEINDGLVKTTIDICNTYKVRNDSWSELYKNWRKNKVKALIEKVVHSRGEW